MGVRVKAGDSFRSHASQRRFGMYPMEKVAGYTLFNDGLVKYV